MKPKTLFSRAIYAVGLIGAFIAGLYLDHFGSNRFSPDPKDWISFLSICITPLTFVAGILALTISYRNYKINTEKYEVDFKYLESNQQINLKMKMLEVLAIEYSKINEEITLLSEKITIQKASVVSNEDGERTFRKQSLLVAGHMVEPNPNSASILERFQAARIERANVLENLSNQLDRLVQERLDILSNSQSIRDTIRTLRPSDTNDLDYYDRRFEKDWIVFDEVVKTALKTLAQRHST